MSKENNVLRFYFLATSLKNKIRQGSIYWNVSAPRRESVAEHVYDTCILAIAMHSEYQMDVDITKVILMLVLHELEEVIIGDITPFDGITEEEKLEQGKKAVANILKTLINKEDYISLTDEFNSRKTKESKFAFLCDKLDFDLQMKMYADQGYIKLNSSVSTNILNNPIVKETIKNGGDASNVFYEYDLPKYNDAPEFRKILDYAYSLDLDDLIKKLH